MVRSVGKSCYSLMARQSTVIKPAGNCNRILQQGTTRYSNITATDKPQSRRRGPNMARGKVYYHTWQVLEDAIMLKRVSKYNVWSCNLQRGVCPLALNGSLSMMNFRAIFGARFGATWAPYRGPHSSKSESAIYGKPGPAITVAPGCSDRISQDFWCLK